MLRAEVPSMPRVTIDIRDEPFSEARRRATDQRRSTREQIAFDIERLYALATTGDDADEREPKLETACR